MSLSARRAWIEMMVSLMLSFGLCVALRKESVDRNNWIKQKYPGCRLSLSARRAWIEIGCWRESRRALGVALRKESVDRNGPAGTYPPDRSGVALRKESVDRNIKNLALWYIHRVALRKESVDRNDAMQIVIIKVDTSLSARRAWIEIQRT